MSASDQYRAKAGEFTQLARAGNAPNEVREFEKLERSFTTLPTTSNGLPIIMTKPGAKGELLDTATLRAQTAAFCMGARTAPTEPPSGPSWQAIEEDPPK
jgi:hypothetical protein